MWEKGRQWTTVGARLARTKGAGDGVPTVAISRVLPHPTGGCPVPSFLLPVSSGFRSWRALRRLIPAVLLAAVASACGGDPAAPDVPAVVQITATGATTILSGGAVSLAATYRDTKGKLVPNAVFTWSSSDAAVATVAPTGQVVGAKAGTATITATTSGTTGTISVTVNPGAASKVVITTQPAGAAAGVRLTTQPVVEIRDAADNLVTTSGATVVAAVNGSGTLTGTLTATATGGVARFTDLALGGTIGGRTLVFSSAGLNAATSNVVELVAGPPIALAYVGSTVRLRSGIAAGATGNAIAVQLRDSEGNNTAVAGRVVTATVGTGLGDAITSGLSTTTNAQGRATFDALTITALAGTRTLTFRTDQIASAPSVSAAIVGGVPARLSIERDVPASIELLAPVTPAPIVRLLDALGNTSPEAGVQVRATRAGSALQGATVLTDDQGRASFTALTVTSGTGTTPVLFAADNFASVSSRTLEVLPADVAPQPAFLTTAVSAADTLARTLELATTTASFLPFIQARNALQQPMSTAGVRWVVRDPSRASVAADGRITGLLPGRTFVVAQGSRTPSVADSLQVFVPRSGTGPIVRTTLSTYRIATDTFSMVVELVSRDGQPFAAADLEFVWPGVATSFFAPFDVTGWLPLRSGVVIQRNDNKDILRVTWASATPVAGPVQLFRFSGRVLRRNRGNEIVITLNQLLRGDMTDVTGSASVYNPFLIIP